MAVCTVDDEYVADRLRWVVQLNDGTMVYEDDGRPGATPSSAWIRLKDHCRAKGLHVVRMWLQFRSNRVEVLPRDAPGYFLVKVAFGVWGGDESFTAYLVGTLDGDVVRLTRYKTPELVIMDTEDRPADPESPSLIARADARVDAHGMPGYNPDGPQDLPPRRTHASQDRQASEGRPHDPGPPRVLTR